MDTERLGEFVSTLVIVAAIAVLAFWRFGFRDPVELLGFAAAVTLVPFAPIVWYLVYRTDAESHMLGPWGPEDVVFLAIVTPGMVGTVWVADTSLGDGALYWIVVIGGIVASIAVAVVARSLAIGEWPPGANAREAREARNDREAPGDEPPGR